VCVVLSSKVQILSVTQDAKASISYKVSVVVTLFVSQSVSIVLAAADRDVLSCWT
jgi:hypothetical protein